MLFECVKAVSGLSYGRRCRRRRYPCRRFTPAFPGVYPCLAIRTDLPTIGRYIERLELNRYYLAGLVIPAGGTA